MINLFFIKIYLDIFIKDYFKLKLFILKILLLLKWRIHWPAFSFDIFQELWVLKNEINCHLEIREKNIWWIMFQLSAMVRVIYWFLWNMLWCMFSYKKKNDLTCNIFTIIVIYLETSSHFIDSYNIEIKKLWKRTTTSRKFQFRRQVIINGFNLNTISDFSENLLIDANYNS
jgi:hypothetical protein